MGACVRRGEGTKDSAALAAGVASGIGTVTWRKLYGYQKRETERDILQLYPVKVLAPFLSFTRIPKRIRNIVLSLGNKPIEGAAVFVLG